MSLSPGTKLGPYEVVSPLGAGGMGEVYRARDPRLGRDVAIKVLPAHLAETPEARARLDREAKAIAALNHPHICTLHDIGHQNGLDYLVLEVVEGETVASRLERGPLPVAEVLRVGEQIADALARAHRSGIIHRDLKPGNVMLTRSGAKLMDFGLARPAGPASAAAIASEATMTKALTSEGALVGTFQYMAPEQLEGKEADARTDIFAFGALLYEMATGQHAFEGDSQASLIGAIMRAEPRPLVELVPMSPPAFERAVRQCLAKDPDDRWQNAGDLKRELSWIAAAGSQAGVPAPVAARRARRLRLAWAPLVAGGALAALGLWRGTAQRATDPHMHVVLAHDAGGVILAEPALDAISPDGSRVAYVVTDSNSTLLYVRDFRSASPRKVSDMTPVFDVFWSPDGRTLGFTTAGDGARLWKVPADGGSPVSICDVKWSRGATWGKNGDIVFAAAPEGPLARVSASGGPVTTVTALDATRHETGHRFPCFLPDGDHFLFSSLPQQSRGWDIFLGALHSNEVKLLLNAESAVTYVDPGYLLYVRDGKLVAQRFDARRRALAGDPVPIADPPAPGQLDASRIATASRDGRLVMLRNAKRPTRVQWVDRSGTVTATLALPPGRYTQVAAAPDGHAVLAVRTVTAVVSEIWQADPARGTATRVSASGTWSANPAWSPDGASYAFGSASEGSERIYVQSADSAPSARPISTLDAQFQFPSGFTPDGRTLILGVLSPATQFDVWTVAVDGGAPKPIVRSAAWEAEGMVSPDGRWLAYTSDETGKSEVYVESFPVPGARARISTGGGAHPQWTRGGKEIVYQNLDPSGGRLLAVDVATGAGLRAGIPRTLFYKSGLLDCSATRDGERILLSVEAGEVLPPALDLVLDWTEQVKDR